MNNEDKKYLEDFINIAKNEMKDVDELTLSKEEVELIGNELEIKNLILKALHKHFSNHEEYEYNELLNQYESCGKEDIEWLKKQGE